MRNVIDSQSSLDTLQHFHICGLGKLIESWKMTLVFKRISRLLIGFLLGNCRRYVYTKILWQHLKNRRQSAFNRSKLCQVFYFLLQDRSRTQVQQKMTFLFDNLFWYYPISKLRKHGLNETIMDLVENWLDSHNCSRITNNSLPFSINTMDDGMCLLN